MKLKRLFIAILCVFSLFIFVGCGREVNTKPIAMNRYFVSEVTSRYSTSSTKKLTLSQFTSDSVDTSTLNNHKYIQFKGDGTWTYGLYIECIYFYFYCNKLTEVSSLTVTVTNLDGDTVDETLPTGTYKKEVKLSINANKNEGVLQRVNIDQNVISTSADLNLTFTLDDEELNTSNDFVWSIYGLQVYAETR